MKVTGPNRTEQHPRPLGPGSQVDDTTLTCREADRERRNLVATVGASRYIDVGGPGRSGERSQARITDDDMLHAFRNPIRAFALDDLTMLVGADQSGRMLEVGVAMAEGVEFIVRAMVAREKFLR